MTDIRFRCPKCAGHLVVEQRAARRRILCPHCDRHILVPYESNMPLPAAVPPVLQVSREDPHPAPTSKAFQGAPGAYRVWVKCPGCGFKKMHIRCPACGSEDKFWIQSGWALCFCGVRSQSVRCSQCHARVAWQHFRALMEPIHSHEGLAETEPVAGESSDS